MLFQSKVIYFFTISAYYFIVIKYIIPIYYDSFMYIRYYQIKGASRWLKGALLIAFLIKLSREIYQVGFLDIFQVFIYAYTSEFTRYLHSSHVAFTANRILTVIIGFFLYRFFTKGEEKVTELSKEVTNFSLAITPKKELITIDKDFVTKLLDSENPAVIKHLLLDLIRENSKETSLALEEFHIFKKDELEETKYAFLLEESFSRDLLQKKKTIFFDILHNYKEAEAFFYHKEESLEKKEELADLKESVHTLYEPMKQKNIRLVYPFTHQNNGEEYLFILLCNQNKRELVDIDPEKISRILTLAHYEDIIREEYDNETFFSRFEYDHDLKQIDLIQKKKKEESFYLELDQAIADPRITIFYKNTLTHKEKVFSSHETVVPRRNFLTSKTPHMRSRLPISLLSLITLRRKERLSSQMKKKLGRKKLLYHSSLKMFSCETTIPFLLQRKTLQPFFLRNKPLFMKTTRHFMKM
jgi:hypothetical protein